MCEFFYLGAKNGTVSRRELRRMLERAADAYRDNPHGIGVFNADGRVFRTMQQVDTGLIDLLTETFTDSRQVVVHLRMATQGTRDIANVHPFTANGLMLAHNGTVHGVYDYGASYDADSKKLLRKIVDQDGDTVEQVQAAMETTSGWLSIFLLEQSTGELYYFRDGANIYFTENEEYVAAATKRQRLATQDVTEPAHGVIYRLTSDGLDRVTRFETGTSLGGLSRSSWSSRSERYPDQWPEYRRSRYQSYRRYREEFDPAAMDVGLDEWFDRSESQYVEAEG